MDWITQDYVKAEAKKGRRQALECTRLHWQQLVKAGPKELKKAFGIKRVSISSAYCAMCYRYLLCGAGMMCPKCLLKCGDVWPKACSTIELWNKYSHRYRWREWRIAAKAVLAKIDRLYERLYGAELKEQGE